MSDVNNNVLALIDMTSIWCSSNHKMTQINRIWPVNLSRVHWLLNNLRLIFSYAELTSKHCMKAMENASNSFLYSHSPEHFVRRKFAVVEPTILRFQRTPLWQYAHLERLQARLQVPVHLHSGTPHSSTIGQRIQRFGMTWKREKDVVLMAVAPLRLK